MRLLVLFLVAFTAHPESLIVTPHRTRHSPLIRGGALSGDGRTLLTWGDGLFSRDLPRLHANRISAGSFADGGCFVDGGLVLQSGPDLGDLTIRRPPGWRPELIDTLAGMHDCMAATLLGHRGFLMIHRFSQVRFYEPPARPGDPWIATDLYSIYTPSKQTGLLLADIDGDGLIDIVCGNYWIKSPTSFELPWRLFAINTYSEVDDSGMLQLALTSPADNLIVSQGHMRDARLTWFEKPDDPKRLWIGHRLGDQFHFVNPHALAAADFNADGKIDFVVGERNEANSRLFVFLNEAGSFRGEQIGRGTEMISIWKLRGKSLLSIGPSAVTLWNYDFRK